MVVASLTKLIHLFSLLSQKCSFESSVIGIARSFLLISEGILHCYKAEDFVWHFSELLNSSCWFYIFLLKKHSSLCCCQGFIWFWGIIKNLGFLLCRWSMLIVTILIFKDQDERLVKCTLTCACMWTYIFACLSLCLCRYLFMYQ